MVNFSSRMKGLLGALILSMLALPICANEISADKVDKLIPLWEKKIEQIMKTQGLPGAAVAVVSKNKVIYLKGFGVKRVGSKEKVNPSTVFQLASLSKPINATLVGVLENKGKLSLQDPVDKLLPQFKVRQYHSSLQLQHIISHSTGIPNHGFDNMIETAASRDKIVGRLQTVKAVAPPGKRFAYHNAMYGLVEDIVGKVSGKSYRRAMQEELFNPLGMKGATLGYQAILDTKDKAYPHVKNRKGKYVPANGYSKNYYAFLAAGGINASVLDLVPFVQLYLGKPNDIISKKQLQQLIKPYVKNPLSVLKNEDKSGRVRDPHYSLGWHSMNYGQKRVIYHQGHLKGFRHFMGFVEDDIGIIILTNADKRHASKMALAFLNLYVK